MYRSTIVYFGIVVLTIHSSFISKHEADTIGITGEVGERENLIKKEELYDEKWTYLFDEELTHWEKWLGAVHSTVDLPGYPKTDDVHTGEPIGLNKDPKNVFTIVKEDKEPILKISGEIYGGLTTKKEYADYHFSIQFRWGEKKWPPRLDSKRDSGILYHAKGKHGAFWNTWMSSLEFQVQEGDCGDFIALADVYGEVPAQKIDNGKGGYYLKYEAKSELIPIKWEKGYISGQVQKSSLHEKPNGEWNTLEIYCFKDESVHIVNGHVVNRVKNAKQKIGQQTTPVIQGKIQLQSEAAEVFYRSAKIRPILNFPSKIADL